MIGFGYGLGTGLRNVLGRSSGIGLGNGLGIGFGNDSGHALGIGLGMVQVMVEGLV